MKSKPLSQIVTRQIFNRFSEIQAASKNLLS